MISNIRVRSRDIDRSAPSSGRDRPARWARNRTASVKSRFSTPMINAITSPPLLQPKQKKELFSG